MEAAAVISGGGAAGAYTVGIQHRLQTNYNFISGTSTGALMAPLLLLQQYEKLKTAYTSVTNKDIYTHEPFNKEGHVKLPNVVARQVAGKKTLGDTKALLGTIKKFFTPEDHIKLNDLGKEFVANLTETRHYPASIVSVSSKEVSYNDLVEAIWASANVPVFMSQLVKDNQEFADGGLLELFSVKPALTRGYKQVDLFIHRVPRAPYDRGKTNDLLHNVQRTFSILTAALENACLREANFLAKEFNAELITTWLPPEMAGEEFLIFDKKKMNYWYNLGYTSVV